MHMIDQYLVEAGLLLVGVMLLVSCMIMWRYSQKRERKIEEKIRHLSNTAIELTTDEFIELRHEAKMDRRGSRDRLNFAGVYILHNKTKDRYYVGQGQKVANRVNAHFSGRGNGDVYADHKYGDVWTIRIIELNQSGFKTLNTLEREAIAYYDAYTHGYNKTRGNQG